MFHYPLTIAEFLGWPSIITSLILTYTGISRKNLTFWGLGIILTVPFTFYIFGANSSIRYIGLILLICQFGILRFIIKEVFWLAYLLLAFYLGIIIWFGYLIMLSS